MNKVSTDKAQVVIVKALQDADIETFDKTDIILYLLSALDNMTRIEDKVKVLKKRVSDR